MERAAVSGLFFDFSKNVKLRITGTDRERYLNGQITNDVRKATEAKAIDACLLDAKGKMTARVSLFATADSYLISADAALQEALQPRLERYVIADDVIIEDVSDQFLIFHVISERAPSMAAAKWIVAAQRFNAPGWDIWLDASMREDSFSQLAGNFRFCNDDCAELARIEQGLPRWGRELTNEIIPIEANLEERCIDYEKGCYLGQEVVSRMKMSGQRNKQLCGLISTKNTPLAVGMRLFDASQKGKDVGWTTSAVRSPALDREIALGFVKRGANSPGTKLEAVGPGEGEGRPSAVEVVDLPFDQ
jgi:folate-binding protein YgfZ